MEESDMKNPVDPGPESDRKIRDSSIQTNSRVQGGIHGK